MRVERLGRIAYPDAHAHMRAALEARIAGTGPDRLILCEHDPVYTLGRSRGAAANLLAPGEVPVVNVERGGDVTFHGPGQLVAYPVVALPAHRQDLHAWLRGIEAVIIEVLAGYGLSGARDARNTGVWLDGRKVAAIGIAARRWVSWHGLAINVSTDLAYFHRVNPCGMPSEWTTRLADHLDPCPSLDQVGEDLAAAFTAWFTRWREPGSGG